jgi:hypothetical protein
MSLSNRLFQVAEVRLGKHRIFASLEHASSISASSWKNAAQKKPIDWSDDETSFMSSCLYDNPVAGNTMTDAVMIALRCREKSQLLSTFIPQERKSLAAEVANDDGHKDFDQDGNFPPGSHKEQMAIELDKFENCVRMLELIRAETK